MLQHDGHRLVVHRVGLAAAAAGHVRGHDVAALAVEQAAFENALDVVRLALALQVVDDAVHLCVATIRWIPAARAFCASRAISSSIFLPTTIIRSASSSMTTTTKGRRSSGSGSSGVRLKGFGTDWPFSAASAIFLL